jgi:S-formylglutathione hydrolase FrmB
VLKLGRVAAILLALAWFTAGPIVPPAPAATQVPTELTLLSTEPLSPRLTLLRFYSPTLGRETSLRVLAPDGFDPDRGQLPVLWLLHGGFGSSADWTTAGDAEALTAGMPLIVVMPDAGTGGWYSNWYRSTGEGPQAWEDHHIGELRPCIESHYNTRDDRGGRAVAGLSMGGFGAMHTAARFPDLFGFAAAFSGAVDIRHPGVAGVVSISPLAHQGVPGDVFGDPVVNETRWRAHNPVDLAANLRTVAVQLRTGNGQPGGRHGGGPDPIEAGCSQATATLHRRLDALGIAHLYDDYGPGAHTWDYWRDALEATLPALLDAFAAPPAPPPAFVEHVAYEPAFEVWNHHVELDRPVYEASTIAIRPDGFSLTGTGTGTVKTPARYATGQTVVATVTGSGAGTIELLAGPDGRVEVPVSLGPASVVDEYPAARLLPVAKRTASVTLAVR